MTRGEDSHVLLVEDNHGDVTLVERAFEERDLPGTLHVAKTGDEALDWLFRRGEHADPPRPDLVLLDLNLPATSGHEVLEEIKADPATRWLPVIVMTSSLSPGDLRDAYGQFANACLIKPADPDEFADRLQALTGFWLDAVELPSAADGGGEA